MPKLTLSTPITLGKKQITELIFRDYTIAEDYLSFDQRGGVAQRIALIASLTGTDEVVIKQLRGPDYVRAEKITSDMLEADAALAEQSAEKKSLESSPPSV
ncbi:MAG: phage tail assembly protein [Methylicorpusculum sp.]|uniref:phage tail assembly protein n=1 Tax=Methylicorpusculum sp. TaxID=2713644 RepID=UPI00271B75EF|nr:phage tail assembly protein [Methylicorpusculum sp.]MDO8941488.1 phage tail assembly protein [Methylicorpusculum sp.]MDP2202268.1 phage tail assembly protein [Methylicorpusculum sp.]